MVRSDVRSIALSGDGLTIASCSSSESVKVRLLHVSLGLCHWFTLQ